MLQTEDRDPTYMTETEDRDPTYPQTEYSKSYYMAKFKNNTV